MTNSSIYILIIAFIGILAIGMSFQKQKQNTIKTSPVESTPSDFPARNIIKSASPSARVQPNYQISASPAPKSQGDWNYPSSKMKTDSERESDDDPGIITNWYKDKIKQQNLNIKTFITTTTNGNVLNKLTGASSNYQINVEISKSAGEQKTHIKIIQG